MNVQSGNAMMASVAVTDDAWKTANFRQNMVTKIDEAILSCGSSTSKNAVEMECQVFSKAKSKDEYLGFVARLIIHIKDMKNKAAGVAAQQNALQVQGQQGQLPVGQMMGVQNNLQMMNQINPMPNNVNIGMGGMNSMMGQQQNYGIHVQQNQLQGNQGQMMPGNPQLQQQLQLQQQHQLQHQQQQSTNQQVQMMNQQNSFLQQQQQQQQQLQNVQQMHNQQQQQQGVPLPNSQMQQNPQLQAHHMQGMMSSPGPQQPMIVGRGGMANPQQMMANRQMMLPQQNMANQLTRMAQQRNVDGVLHSSYSPGGGPIQRPMTPNQFMSPASQSNMGMGASPSPQGMGPGPAPPYGNSPAAAGGGMIHSPAGGGIRPYMVPSPGSSLNTPMMVAPTPSPRNTEDIACMEKIRELRKYTDLLQKMLAKVGNDDVEKSSKMKKLLDILTNPRSSVSMDLLIKCEAALKKMERTDAGGPASVPQQTPGKDQTSPFTQFFESVQTMNKFPSAAHTWKRTIQPAMDAFFGHSFLFEEIRTEEESEDSEDEDPPSPWVLHKEIQLLNALKFKVKYESETGKLLCILMDRNLPTIPPLRIQVTPDYPDQSPRIVGMTKDYSSTRLLSSIAQGLKSRMLNFSEKFTVTEILSNWEMSIRQVANGTPRKLGFKLKEVGKGRTSVGEGHNSSTTEKTPIPKRT